VRRSIWSKKVSRTPIRDVKMRTAMVKHTKKLQKKKLKTKRGDKEEKDAKGGIGGGKRRTRAALLREQQYRSKRRARPVRKLAPKIKR